MQATTGHLGTLASVVTLVALWLPLKFDLQRGRLALLCAELVTVTLFFATAE